MTARRIPRRLLALFIGLSFLLILIAVFVFKPEAPGRSKAVVARLRVGPPPLPRPHRARIRPGTTLADILSRRGFSPSEIARLREDVRPVHDLAKLQAGRILRFYPAPDLSIVGFEYDIDELHFLRVRSEGGRYRAEILSYPYQVRKAFVWGTIEDNLISAVEKSGETIPLALGLAEIFGWDIDFYTDLRAGDRFFVHYEKRYIDGRFAGYGNILAARFTNRGKDFCAVRYAYPDTKTADYFDPDGGSLRKEFLRSPFKFTPRITSHFSSSRLHPIRRILRPHYGVDYAAPIGTPVQATAEGTVLFAGTNGAAGRMVKIRHANAYVTMYLHLSGLAAGIRTGARVGSGQIIGAVGSSGESTGPHLDYRVQYHDRYINPLSWRFSPAAPLRAEFGRDFERTAAGYNLLFQAPFLFGLRALLFSLF
jgi:murein DD-endopeptidase MepM/ murein hydrolase activator NlpD